ncbi:MAG: serine hydrolase [Clostridiales bacterium]|jgi:CubicO group peptidase (beta-lactamase class C family)|nr:serine hydrolase [Clostridiales bacterium]
MSAIKIPRAESPEAVGVSSGCIKEFIDDLKANNIEMHSLMVIRDGKVAVECYNHPFSANRPHSCYSVSKSVTSTAIGFAVSEGLISLDTLVVDIFPEYRENKKDSYLNQLNIRHLVSMCSGKNVDILKDKGKIDWLDDFMKSPWYAKPGTDFRYVNENIYVLSAIIHKVTGMCIRDYLQPRLFEPLGIDYPFWETDRNGIEAGGWGIYLKTEDIAKIMLCYLQDGKFEGRQVIPEEWTRTATVKHVDNNLGTAPDSSAGYGYCFWMCNLNTPSYRCEGLFGQFGIVFKEYNAVVAFTGAEAITQRVLDSMWKFFPAAFDNAGKEGYVVENLSEELSKLCLEKPLYNSRSILEKRLDGRRIKMRKKLLLNIAGFPMSVLPLAVTYMTTDKAGNIDNIVFNFGDDECSFTWTEGDEKNTVACGMDGKYREGVMRLGGIDYRVLASACWRPRNTLILDIRPIETIAKRRLAFTFDGNKVKMKPSSTPEVVNITKFIKDGAKDILPNEFLVKLAQIVIDYLPVIVEPVHKGKIK